MIKLMQNSKLTCRLIICQRVDGAMMSKAAKSNNEYLRFYFVFILKIINNNTNNNNFKAIFFQLELHRTKVVVRKENW